MWRRDMRSISVQVENTLKNPGKWACFFYVYESQEFLIEKNKSNETQMLSKVFQFHDFRFLVNIKINMNFKLIKSITLALHSFCI